MVYFFRTVLLTEHSDIVVFGVLAVLFKTGNPGPIKVRVQCMVSFGVL